MLKGYFDAFKKDRDFRSRTGRQEFWHAALPDTVILALVIAGYFLFNDINIIFLVPGLLYIAITTTSRLALWTRRLHDVGLKGTFAFIILIPVLGLLALWFVFMSDSQPKDNEYGKYIKVQNKKKSSPKSKKK